MKLMEIGTDNGDAWKVNANNNYIKTITHMTLGNFRVFSLHNTPLKFIYHIRLWLAGTHDSL